MFCSVYSDGQDISHPPGCPKDIAENTCSHPSVWQVSEEQTFLHLGPLS